LILESFVFAYQITLFFLLTLQQNNHQKKIQTNRKNLKETEPQGYF